MPFENPISYHMERLPVPLTVEEYRQKAERLAALEGDLASHVADMKSKQSTMAARKKEIESLIYQLAAVMRDKAELRDVQVNVVIDAGEALELRADTQEVLRRRPPRPEERQGALFRDVNPQEEENEDDDGSAEPS